MSNLREYIVSLHRREDLDEFYQDMETLRSTPYNCMPERAVSCFLRRPISRNTHYMLTDEEAEVLRKDPRILAVSLTPKELGLVVKKFWTATSSNWDKADIPVDGQLNWGLLRSIEGTQRSDWGSDSTTSQTASVTINEEGRNVDVIIVDGHIDPDHPEFAVNPDGTGGSRVIQFDWHTLTASAVGINDDVSFAEPLTSTYIYPPYNDPTYPTDGDLNGIPDRTDDNNHGCHVAGTVAGITQGWARKANIYNINPYGTNVNTFGIMILFDYIRAFHAAKAINPQTGRKNPTICNHSWGLEWRIDLTVNPAASLNFRGATINGPFTDTELRSYGIFAVDGRAYIPSEYIPIDVDIQDAIADGIITVGAAGNSFTKIDVPGGQDYDNTATFTDLGFLYPYRGSSPCKSPGVICVGSVDALSTEYKAQYSNTGPRIDVWAPGTNIISSTHFGGVADSRGGGLLDKYQGTSMASPQVCGVLACILEVYPNLTQTEALDYIKKYAKTSQLTDGTGQLNNYISLHGAPNLYLAYNKERATEGGIFPKLNYKPRPNSGAVYPRVRRS